MFGASLLSHSPPHAVLRLAVLVLLLSCAGCSSSRSFCSGDGSAISVVIVDEQGRLLPGLRARTVSQPSGATLTRDYVRRTYAEGEGRYVVMGDAYRELIDSERAAFDFVVDAGAAQLTEAYTFTRDGCSVRKVAGPDTLRVSLLR